MGLFDRTSQGMFATTLAALALTRPLAPATAAALQLHRSSNVRRRALSAVASAADGSEPEVRKRVLSGVQPTGVLHLGNYLGAIRQWVANQELYDNYFCVVDLHAITSPHDPKKLREDSLSAAAMYLASGIDPEKSKVFIQSH